MSEVSDCPNCSTKIKSAMFGSVILLKDSKARTINEYLETKAPGYCSKCGPDLYEKAVQNVHVEEGNISREIGKYIQVLPVVTIHHPLQWDYEVLGMVTGQSTTGTGIFTEFAASWTDLFGKQSGKYNQKLRTGEQLCFTQIRKACYEMGGNAVIGTDIDYAEVGGDKGMLMVCMAGTAVNLKNVELLGDSVVQQMSVLATKHNRLKHLMSLDISGVYN